MHPLGTIGPAQELVGFLVTDAGVSSGIPRERVSPDFVEPTFCLLSVAAFGLVK